MPVLVELDWWINGEHDVTLEGAPGLGPVIGKTPDVNNDGVILKVDVFLVLLV
jgi:hypothetical protein